MFDQAEIDNFRRSYDTLAASQPQQQPQQKKGASGLRGLLLNALPVVGGAVGTVAGGLAGTVLPGAGNIAGAVGGGAVGSGLGEFLRQKLSGEADNGIDKGNIVEEGLFGALPGVGKGLKAGKAAITAARAGETAVDAGKTAQTTEAAMQARKGLKATIQNGAQQASQEGMGLTVGQSAGRGKVLTPDKADELQDFITNRSQQYGGIRAGKPIDQARDAQTVHNNVKKALDDTLAQIDRPLAAGEPQSVLSSALSKIADDPAITGSTKTVEKFKAKIEKAKSLKDLEAIRREADDIAFTSTGAGKTSAAAQSHAVRDAIDEFITPLSDDYKAVKGDYTLSRDALEATSKANKNAKGFKVPFIGTEVGAQTIPGVKNKVAAKLSGAGTPPVESSKPSFRPFIGQTAKATIPQAGYRAGSSALFGTPFVNQETQPEQQAQSQLDQPALTNEEAEALRSAPQAPPEGDTSLFSDPTKVEQAYMQLLAAGNMKGASALIEGYKLFGQKAEEKPLSAEASKTIANANSGLTSLSQLESIINKQGGVSKGTLVPGRSLFGGLGSNALGTAEYDTAAKNLTDVITRLRTGAALTDSEAAFYQSQVPQAFDSPEVRAQKIQTFRDLFQSVANRTGSAGTDTQAALGI